MKTAQTYVLRLWLEPREPPNWRASLSDPRHQDIRYFASPEALLEFLTELVGEPRVEKSSG